MSPPNSVCGLCLKAAADVRYKLLMDVTGRDIAEWTFNTVSLVAEADKLCTKCCRDLGLLGEMLHRWRNKVRVSLAASPEAGKREEVSFGGSKSSMKPVSWSKARKSLLGKINNNHNNNNNDNINVNNKNGSKNSFPSQESLSDDEIFIEETRGAADTDAGASEKEICGNGIAESEGNHRVRESEDDVIMEPSPPKSPPSLPPSSALPSPPLPSIDSSVLCSACGLQCASQKLLVAHMKTHPKTTATPATFVCQFCSKAFCSKRWLKQHEKTHREDKNAGEEGPRIPECPECGKTFKFLKGHLKKIHGIGGEKEFLCRFCPAAFWRRERLEDHERMHTNEKPFACDRCDRQFRCLAFLRRHQTIHTGERKYQCKYCHKTFRQANNKIVHEQTVHENKRYLCSKGCGKKFMRRKHQREHVEDCNGC